MSGGTHRERRGLRIVVRYGRSVSHVGTVAEAAELMGYLNQQIVVDLPTHAPRKRKDAEPEEETCSTGNLHCGLLHRQHRVVPTGIRRRDHSAAAATASHAHQPTP